MLVFIMAAAPAREPVEAPDSIVNREFAPVSPGSVIPVAGWAVTPTNDLPGGMMFRAY